MAVPKLPQHVVQMMAAREHRLAHMVWHGARNFWERLSPQARQQFTQLYPGWAPPRPWLTTGGSPNDSNDSGEDFLYMHRQMIAEVDRILAQVGQADYPRVQGWQQIPKPDDADYPILPIPGQNIPDKDPAVYQNAYVPWVTRYSDPAWLRSVSLGKLGSDLEGTIHNSMHMRWAAPSAVGYRPGSVLQPVDTRWDDARYDFLGDTYSSHVNPIFWKIHGWVDDRINDWAAANDVQQIQWKGTWTGPMAHDHSGGRVGMLAMMAAPDQTEKLEGALSLLSEAGFTGFIAPMARR